MNTSVEHVRHLEEKNKGLKETVRQLLKDSEPAMKNKEIYIIGGGSSLKGFDFNQLKDLDTIAVNMAALDVPDPTYCITGDSNIFRKLQEGFFESVETTWVVTIDTNHPVMKFKDGRIEHIHSNFVYNPFCVNMLIPYKRCDGIGFSFKDFRSGFNSGFCAFQLAVLLGYKKIHLLGFDMRKNEQTTHYHNWYKGKSTISKTAFVKFYDNFVLALQIIKEKTDVKVVSCSKISRLNKHIPYCPLESI